VLVTRDDFDNFLSQLTSDRLTVDVETTGLKTFPRDGKSADVVAGVAVKSHNISMYFPIRHAGGENIEAGQYRRLLDRLEQATTLVNHNTGFDLAMLRNDGMKTPRDYVDTLPGTHLYNENTGHGLKDFCAQYVEKGADAERDELHKKLRAWGFGPADMWRIPPDQVAHYACKDVDLADKLDGWLRQNLYRPHLYDEMCRFSAMLNEMSQQGVWVNRLTIASLAAEARGKAMEQLALIRDLAGYPVNPNSSDQVRKWLKLPNSKDETLEAAGGPGAEAVRSFRSWNKSITMYYDRYLELVDPNDTLHCEFRVDGTVSGRLSCARPNLQQVPRDCETQKVKHVFEARPGYTFVEVDFSQAEIRVAAHYTRDADLISVLGDPNGDTHTAVAKRLGVSRHVGKTINLSIVYGIGAARLAEVLGVPEKTARGFLDQYHAAYPGFRKMARAAQRVAEDKGYIETYVGRRRHFNCKEAEPRKAFNNLVQGGTADMVRRTMLRIRDEMSEIRSLIQVHDSLIAEIPRDGHERDAAMVMKAVFEDQPWCRVKIKADVKMGPTWAFMEKVE
jgi:DNA polymerase-1